MIDEPELSTEEVAKSTPMTLQELARGNDHNVPLLKRKFLAWRTRKHLELDRQSMDEAAKYFQASTKAMDSATELCRAKDRLQNIGRELEQRGAIHDASHETTILEERAKQDWFRFVSTKYQLGHEDAKMRIKQLAELVRSQSSQPEKSKREQLGEAWKNITGVLEFQRETDEAIETDIQERKAEVPSTDPRRDEKQAAIEALGAEMRLVRDRIIREMWLAKP